MEGPGAWRLTTESIAANHEPWLNPIEEALLRWIGDAGRSAVSAAGYLLPLLISNALIALPALALLLVQPSWLNPLGFVRAALGSGAAHHDLLSHQQRSVWGATLLIRNQKREVQRACAGCRDGRVAWADGGLLPCLVNAALEMWREPQESPRS